MSNTRQLTMLRSAMGPVIAEALTDPEVIEVLLNPDGSLWLDRLTTGRRSTGHRLTASAAERIIRLVAASLGQEVHPQAPHVSGELPDSGERFEAWLPPVVRGPSFAIRKRAVSLIRLERYIEEGILSSGHAIFLKRAVQERKNILIAGASSSGKTTLANALLQEIAATGDRVIVLEDTVELQCAAADRVALRTLPGSVSMADLVRSTVRLRPDRVVMGEVRGAEMLDLLKVWSTGHPGGLATLHANSARGALVRVEQLVGEVLVNVPRGLIVEAIDVIVFIERRADTRRVEEILRVTGLNAQGYACQPIPHDTGEAE